MAWMFMAAIVVGKHRIAIVHEIPGRVVFRKGLAELLCGPCSRGVVGDGDVDDSSSVVRENHEYEQELVGNRWHDEEIGSHDLADMGS
jgi:hypothetical protein